jgi:TRAP transporter TAXI family solute receptor
MVRKVRQKTRQLARQLSTPGVSMRDLSAQQWREFLMLAAPAIVLVVAALWAASRFIEPAPPKTVTITTGTAGGGYETFARRYAQVLKKSSITLEVQASAGSGENLERVRVGKSDLALVQGGTVPPEDAEKYISLGRMFHEPVWIFTRDKTAIRRLSELTGKRIAIGAPGSGTLKLATDLLRHNGVTAATATLLEIGGQAATDALIGGSADVAILAAAADSPLVRELLHLPQISLISLDQAEAYTRIFPYLTRIVLPKGAIDLVRNVPDRDIELIAPMAALIASPDLHPAIIGLIVEAAKQVHSTGGFFRRFGEFPKVDDPEFAMSEDATRVYKDGPPVLQRYFPFWLATFIERMRVMILPFATIILPLIKLVPALYKWRVRRRLHFWYGELTALELAVDRENGEGVMARHLEQMARIERGVSAIPVPVSFAEQYYTLRGALSLVRARLS